MAGGLLGAKGVATAGLVMLLAVLAARATADVGGLRTWLLQQSPWQMATRSFFVLAVVALGRDWLLQGLAQWKVRRQAAKGARSHPQGRMRSPPTRPTRPT